MTMGPAERPTLILASSSPRRAGLLRQIGLCFEIAPSNFDERHENRPAAPAKLVEELALGKARDVAAGRKGGLVLGADTVVILEGAVLEKPADAAEAREMLAGLAGKWHEVYTGLALVEAESGRSLIGHERTRVLFRPLKMAEIAAYVASGEPLDKAGAYGIQGLGATLVARIEGCYTNVVGLPLPRLTLMLREMGWEVLGSGGQGVSG